MTRPRPQTLPPPSRARRVGSPGLMPSPLPRSPRHRSRASARRARDCLYPAIRSARRHRPSRRSAPAIPHSSCRSMARLRRSSPRSTRSAPAVTSILPASAATGGSWTRSTIRPTPTTRHRRNGIGRCGSRGAIARFLLPRLGWQPMGGRTRHARGCTSPQLVAVPLDPSDTIAPTTTNCAGTSGIQFQEPNGYNGTPIDATATIAAAGLNEPTVSFSYTSPITLGTPVTFTAVGTDPFNSPLSYTWSLPAQWSNNELAVHAAQLLHVDPRAVHQLHVHRVGRQSRVRHRDRSRWALADREFRRRRRGFDNNHGDLFGWSVGLRTTRHRDGNGRSGQPVQQHPLVLPADDRICPVSLSQRGHSRRPVPVTPSHVITTAAGTATMTLPPLPIAGSPYSVSATYLGASRALESGFNPSGVATRRPRSARWCSRRRHPSTWSHRRPPRCTDSPCHFTAAVSPTTPAQGTPTGTVQFYADGSTLGSPVPVDSYGTATSVSTSALKTNNGPFGLQDIGAVYSGNGSFTTSSQSMFQVVNADPTTTSVTSSGNPSRYGQPVTFTASVTGCSQYRDPEWDRAIQH